MTPATGYWQKKSLSDKKMIKTVTELYHHLLNQTKKGAQSAFSTHSLAI